MKRLIILVALALVASYMYAQTNTFPPNGNVGIGTMTPTTGLQLGQLSSNVESKQILIPGAYNFERFKLGHIGNGNMALEMVNHTNYLDAYGVKLTADADHGAAGLQFQYASIKTNYDSLTYKTAMFMSTNGNIGIGTLIPTEKLSVKGKVRAQEIKVEMANWADFVFAKNYELPTLQETEKHIKEKGHLPGIPSAAEVEKNGIELGDMNKKLLQKIEELTLYLIEQGKRIEASDEKIRSQHVEIRDQKTTVNQLQKKLEKLTEKIK